MFDCLKNKGKIYELHWRTKSQLFLVHEEKYMFLTYFFYADFLFIRKISLT